MTNVIKFPTPNDSIFPNNREESLKQIQEFRIEYCDNAVTDAFEAMMAVFNSYGFHIIPQSPYLKDTVFLEEAMKAFTYRQKNLEHPLQDIITNVISVPGDPEPAVTKKKRKKKDTTPT